MLRRVVVAAVLGLVPACSRECTEVGYSDALTIGGDVGSVAEVATVCIDDRCYGPPLDGSVAPDFARLESSTPGRLVLLVRAGTLPDRAATVRVTVVVGGRVYEGRAERPVSQRSPNGKGCGPDQRTQVVTVA